MVPTFACYEYSSFKADDEQGDSGVLVVSPQPRSVALWLCVGAGTKVVYPLTKFCSKGVVPEYFESRIIKMSKREIGLTNRRTDGNELPRPFKKAKLIM